MITSIWILIAVAIGPTGPVSPPMQAFPSEALCLLGKKSYDSTGDKLVKRGSLISHRTKCIPFKLPSTRQGRS